MNENKPAIGLPHFQNFTQNHWNEVKDLNIKGFRTLVREKCLVLTIEEENHLKTWFNNQKTACKRLVDR
jgi:hypothetical protein